MTLIDRQCLSRRRFLCGLGVTAASLTSSNLTSVFGDTPGESPIILGDGKHRYEWVRGWGKLPAGMKYGNTHGGVAVDAQNRVYISTDGDGSIIVFNRAGEYVGSLGREWKPDKAGDGTHDMQLHGEGKQQFIYLVSLFRHEFAKITLQGEPVWIKGFPEQSGIYKSKDEFKPTGITIAPNGDFYVTDGYGANYIHRYNAKGEYLNSWGGKSTREKEDGKFNTPHKIVIDQRGKEPLVLVTDRANHRHRVGRGVEDGEHPRHEVDTSGDHRCGIDQGADRRGALHGVGQPDVERDLRGLARGAHEQAQADHVDEQPFGSPGRRDRALENSDASGINGGTDDGAG